MIDRINTLENEIKTLQRTILHIMPYRTPIIHNCAEMIAEITKIIEIKEKEIKNQLMQD
tara:strand:- start:930 stop:1106 length:177 start_codon:yes stop_codon:yes gene_type:complete